MANAQHDRLQVSIDAVNFLASLGPLVRPAVWGGAANALATRPIDAYSIECRTEGIGRATHSMTSGTSGPRSMD